MTASHRLAAAVDEHLRALDPATLPGVIAGVTSLDRTVHIGATGVRRAGTDTALTVDTVVGLYSTSKAVTATAALQLVDDGLLDLDAPAAVHLPEIGEIMVVDGFDDGVPRLRPPRTAITMRHLLTHTSGFGYHSFDATLTRAIAALGLPDITTNQRPALRLPLLFDPGTRWLYGAGVDWAGLIVEAITGRRLGAVFGERIFAPLGMCDTGFERSAEQRARSSSVHLRRLDGSVKALPDAPGPDAPAQHMGGHGLFGTVGDYLAFLRLWLRDGLSDTGEQILSPGTAQAAWPNQLGARAITALPAVDTKSTHPIEFFPGTPKGWSLTGMTVQADAPTGRPAGSVGWAGLANLYYWADRRNGIAGFWAAQLFPFGDPIARDAALDFESAVYRALR
ncbi:MAG: serine hydrolase domain-containing protein [Gordonia sp. (in: high G+C Gram-positive bacteria)]